MIDTPPQSTPKARGVLFLVVGPSGAGKDTLMDGVRAARPDLLFPKRVVTRAADAGGEDYDAVSPDMFDAQEADGAFALSWRAHGLAYGVPNSAAEALADGRSVVANVSRTVIEQARRAYPPVLPLHVTAPREVLAQRLTARGRESAEDIAARLDRANPTAEIPGAITILNDGPPEHGVAKMLQAIDAATAQSPINPAPITPALINPVTDSGGEA
ncbi:MAG: phosphonate metabolism protein/1,5-bisphosphokinase (PRPP-forming) PhnN [Rhodobacteraceae bacterium]|nr:phosphonate metabolism protein/1,5-bisphosphokinase (PRPP-forming) PhnN [Paracoccaceae bacterium]